MFTSSAVPASISQRKSWLVAVTALDRISSRRGSEECSNSSSAIREGAFLGTPAVNIGTRQAMRERGHNVIDVGYDRREIADAMFAQIRHGPYASEPIYGDGHAGERIAEVLARCSWQLQKRITY